MDLNRVTSCVFFHYEGFSSYMLRRLDPGASPSSVIRPSVPIHASICLLSDARFEIWAFGHCGYLVYRRERKRRSLPVHEMSPSFLVLPG